MIEIVLLNYLKEVLSVDVFMEIPPNPPDTYVRIEKTGSGEEEHINMATFALQWLLLHCSLMQIRCMRLLY